MFHFRAWARRFANYVNWVSRRPRKARRPSYSYFTPRVEQLEDKVLLSTVTWTAGAGDWGMAANWTDQSSFTHRTPTATDDAVINTAVTVTHAVNTTDKIKSLTLGAPGIGTNLTLSAGTIDASGVSASGTVQEVGGGSNLSLQGGTLANATVAAGALVTATSTQSGLSNITLNGTLDLATNNNANILVTNNLTLGTGVTLQVGKSDGTTAAFVSLQGPSNTINSSSGTATIAFGNNASNWIDPQTDGETVTLGAGLVIRGGYGRVGNSPATIFNFGTIDATTANNVPTSDLITVDLGAGGVNEPGGVIEAINPIPSQYPASQVGLQIDQGSTSGSGWTNQGTVTITGGTLRVGLPNRPVEAWSNTGTISSTNSTVMLSGVFTQAGLGTFTRDAASTVNLDGTITGGLTLNDTLGAWYLTGNGVLSGGTFAIAGGSSASTQLIVTGLDGTLDGVTLASAVDLTTINGAAFRVTNGLTVNTNQPIGSATNASQSASINFGDSDQTLGGTGSLVFGAGTGNQIAEPYNGRTLTIGSGLTIRGKNGEFHLPSASATLVNTGTIQSDVAGGTITIDPAGTFTNTGVLKAVNGTLAVNPATFSNLSSGTLAGGTFYVFAGATLTLNGVVTTNQANINLVNAGATFAAISGLQTNQSSFALLGGASFTTTGAFSNNGTLNVGPGTFNVTGNYTQTVADILDVAINSRTPGSGYGQVNITGTATLAGTLNVTQLGGFVSTIGDVFQAVTYGSVNSGFNTINVPDLSGSSAAMKSNFGPSTFRLLTIPAAATVYWIGTNGNWTTGTNWSTNSAPAAGDNVYIPAGYTITYATTATVATLRTDSAFLLSGNLTVTGTFTTNAATTWSGSTVNAGTWNNTGSLTLNGAAVDTLTGTLNNTATITDANDTLQLAGGTLNNQAAGIYDIQVDGNILQPNGSGTFNNAGTFKKTAQTGRSVVGGGNLTFNNTGTVEVDSGDLYVTATVTQAVAPTLTGGTWKVLNGTTLNIASAVNLTTNSGNVTLGGGATFTNLSGFTTNSATGSFTVTGGGTFTTAGDFANQGNLVVGPGRLTVSGHYTQTHTASLTIQLGGTSAGTGYGVLTVTGVANLDGTLAVAMVNGFVLPDAAAFTIITATTFSGDFAVKTGLSQLTSDLTTSVAGGSYGLNAASVFFVTTTADTGAGSLRDAITQANSNANSNRILFKLVTSDSGFTNGSWTIAPQSALPFISNPVILDGTSQSGYAGQPLVALDGTSTGAADGLHLTTGNSTVKGLAIGNFAHAGIVIDGGSANSIFANYIGTNAAGTAALGNNIGVAVDNGATAVLIGGTAAGAGNVISGNSEYGVYVTGSTSTGAVIQGNIIGLNAAGIAALGNAFRGILVDSAPGVTIGGDAAAGGTLPARNIISGNGGAGVEFTGTTATGAVIQGNYIGTDVTGTLGLGNGQEGVVINGAANATIGGTTAGAGNVISANASHGLNLLGSTVTGAVVQGNIIGLNAAGTAALGNSLRGIAVTDASASTIGGTTAAARNVISANYTGIYVAGGIAILVEGNYIGANAAGTAAIGNARDGITLSNASGNTIGGTTAGARNIISGNNGNGIAIAGAGTTGNVIQGNYIGTNAAGTASLSNSVGVGVDNGADAVTIGGTAVGAGNLISGNTNFGILLGTGAGVVTVQGNFIGTNAAGDAAVGNLDGIESGSTTSGSVVGGTTAAARNVISGNTRYNIASIGQHLLVEGNYIGTNAAGTAGLGGSGLAGVLLTGASNNTIGGGAGAGNLISGNPQLGVWITNASSANTVAGNLIGTNAAGTAALGNGTVGVAIDAGAHDNTIGGTTAALRNIISGNATDGVQISGTGTSGNVVEGNYIGTNSLGTAALANRYAGVQVVGGARDNTIGGAAGAGNVISGNRAVGVLISGAFDNTVSGNFIGTDATGTTAYDAGGHPIGNGVAAGQYGVQINGGSTGNVVGGTTAGGGNLISGNFIGVGISQSDTTSNVIAGNLIGTDVTGTVTTDVSGNALGNQSDGIQVVDGPYGNTIGGASLGARNVISGNGLLGDAPELSAGIAIDGSGDGVSQIVVLGNFIGTDITGVNPLGNSIGVVLTNGTSDNTIGGTTAAARNVISGNSGDGVDITGAGTTGNVVQGNYLGTNAAGTAALGNSGAGVAVGNGASSNSIGLAGTGNVISGNAGTGVSLGNAGTGNLVLGNLIGTNAAGTAALGNVGGIAVAFSDGETIGGSTAGARNIISGNSGAGITLNVTSVDFIEGNWIGLNAAGTAAIYNTAEGILTTTFVSNIAIGGTAAGAGNVIADGILLAASSPANITIQGNFIGTDPTGTIALGMGAGINVRVGGVVIGGTTAAARNIISGNPNGGIGISGAAATGDIVEGNYIGTDVTGTLALGNSIGIQINTGASGNTIGGTTAAARNLISGNSSTGVQITGSGTTGNVVQGNYLGTNATGTTALGNGIFGVLVGETSGNTVGGMTSGSGNVISGNLIGVGIQGFSLQTQNNVVTGNLIGTNAAGSAALGNTRSGIEIAGAYAHFNQVGDGSAAGRNVVSGNAGYGVEIFSGADANVVAGNYVGTDVTGTIALGDGGAGIRLTSAGNTIGGTAAGAGNLISGNIGAGLGLGTAGASANVVEGNLVGTDYTGSHALGNINGIVLDSGASNNIIGGTTAAARNVISGNNGNAGDGVRITDAGTTGNVVEGNYIGTNAAGTAPLANVSGVNLQFVSSNTIGGSALGAGNVISGNSYQGIQVYGNDAGMLGNTIQGNFVGTNAAGNAAIGNANFGIILNGSANNLIGGNVPAARNLISGNIGQGIYTQDASASLHATGNVIKGNYIGTDVTGAAALGNLAHGIDIVSANNTVGGTTVAARNVISGNASNGVDVSGTGATGNVVAGNYIGTNATGTTAVGNGTGVAIGNGAANNLIGGNGVGTRLIAQGDALTYAAGIAAAPNGDLYVSDGGNGLVRVNPSTGAQTVLASNFSNPAVAPDGTIYAGAGVELARVDPSTGAATFVIGDQFHIYTAGSDGYLYRTKDTYTELFRVDPATGAETTVASGNHLTYVQVIAAAPGGKLIVWNGDTGDFVRVDPQTGQQTVIGNFSGPPVTGATVSAAGLLYFSDTDYVATTEVRVLDPQTQTVSLVTSGGSRDRFTGIAVGADGKLYVSNGTAGSVIRVDPNTGAQTVVSAGDSFGDLSHMATGPDGTLYVSEGSGGAINAIDPTTNARRVIVPSGGAANSSGLAVIGGKLYVSFGSNSTLAQIDLATGARRDITLGATIYNLAPAPNGKLYVDDYNARTVYLVDPATGNQSVFASGGLLGLANVALVGFGAAPDGTIYTGSSSEIIKIDPAGVQSVLATNVTSQFEINGLAVGSDGVPYVLAVGKIIRLDPTTGDLTVYFAPTGMQFPTAIAAGPNGLLYLADTGNQRVYQVYPAAGNLISGNAGTGISVTDSGTTGNTIVGNRIGTNAAGTSAVANQGDGVSISAGAAGNTVGGPTDADRNVIAGNTGAGINIKAANNNIVRQNYIGTRADGTSALANATGILITNGTGNQVGTGTAYTQQVVSSGNLLNQTRGLARAPGGLMYVLATTVQTSTGGPSAIVRIDPTTGTQTAILNDPDLLQYAQDLTFANGSLYVAAAIWPNPPAIVRVDPVTGQETTVSSGGNLVYPAGIAAAVNGDLYVVDQGDFFSNAPARVIRINPTTGAQTVVSTGGYLNSPTFLTIASSGDLYTFDTQQEKVVRIDPATGHQTIVPTRSGALYQLAGLAAGPDGSLYGVASQQNEFVRIDPASGATTVVAIGSNFTGGAGGLVAAPGGTFYLTDVDTRSVVHLIPAAANVISGNSHSGILVSAQSTQNTLQGNYIGTNAAGTAALGNGGAGVDVVGATAITVSGNVISGNASDGVLLTGVGTTGNVVEGNTIGLNVNGDDLISGTAAWFKAETNEAIIPNRVVAAHGGFGYTTGKVGAQAFSFNGIDADFQVKTLTGLEPAAAVSVDLWVKSAGPGSNSYLLAKGAGGGTTSSYALTTGPSGGLMFAVDVGGTLFSSDDAGTAIWDNNWHHVAGTYDGTAVRLYVDGVQVGAGTAASGSIRYGLSATDDLFFGSRNGASFFAGAIDEIGIFNRALTPGEVARINQLGSIGKDSFFGNANGITVAPGANNTTIGTSGAGNVISGNTGYGIAATGVTGLTVSGNYIGTDSTGSTKFGQVAAVGNALVGVSLTDVSASTIGGLTATPGTGAGNLISGNRTGNVTLATATTGTHDVTIEGNIVGLNADGIYGLNASGLTGRADVDGITLTDSFNITIGGTAAGARNVVTGNGNGSVAITITGSASTANVVAGNYLGTDLTGSGLASAAYTREGVFIANGAHGNVVGGTSSAARNVIAAGNAGVELSSADHNTVSGNYIGLKADNSGTTGGAFGVDDFGSFNTVGGTTVGERNIISGHNDIGIYSSSNGSLYEGNYIGTDATGTVAFGNGTGIFS